MGLPEQVHAQQDEHNAGDRKSRQRRTPDQARCQAEVIGLRTWDVDHPEQTARLAKGME